jgi:virulence factor
MTAPRPLRLGLIGCGGIFRSVYASIFQRLAGRVHLAAVCDLDPAAASAAATQFGLARFLTDPAALLSAEKLDAVIILTPEHANAPTAMAVLRAGLPVYLEKPPALSSVELAQLREVERETGGVVYVAFNRRHAPLARQLRLPDRPLRRVTAALDRSDRAAASFPNTAIHLLDSVPFFAGAALEQAQVRFSPGPEETGWKISGQIAGAPSEWLFRPTAKASAEWFRFEFEGAARELHFLTPGGQSSDSFLRVEENGAPPEIIPAAVGDDLETMGYVDCLRCFLDHLERRDLAASPHRLSSAAESIALMEAMQRAASSLL